jgi:glycerol-1-phosphate dehydrogenase [NAD(P)+]
MNLNEILLKLKNCPCGRQHSFHTHAAEIGEGLTGRAGRILLDNAFPRRILLVADENTIKASGGLRDSLWENGFVIKEHIFPNLVYARIEDVNLLRGLCAEADGLLAVGTGSVSDLCRLAAYMENKAFAIYATAPSMDGFASDSAPILENGFKLTRQAKQPEVIIADTLVLASAPNELKAAGFGDMAAKFTALADWRISHILTGEYYCPKIAELVETGLDKVMPMADRVRENDTEAAQSIMEGLVMSGLAMSLANSSRPASGAEHVLSHFWECKKLQAGKWVEFHGKKTGVASVIITELYRRLAEVTMIETHKDLTDWDMVYKAYGGGFADEMMKMNRPTITDEIDPAILQEKWPEIRNIIKETLPEAETLRSILKRAGAATEPSEVNIDEDMLKLGLTYHPYMRHRVILTRLLPMIDLGVDIGL